MNKITQELADKIDDLLEEYENEDIQADKLRERVISDIDNRC